MPPNDHYKHSTVRALWGVGMAHGFQHPLRGLSVSLLHGQRGFFVCVCWWSSRYIAQGCQHLDMQLNPTARCKMSTYIARTSWFARVILTMVVGLTLASIHVEAKSSTTTASTLTMTRYHYASPTPTNLKTTFPIPFGAEKNDYYVIFANFSQVSDDYILNVNFNGTTSSTTTEYNLRSILFFTGGTSPRYVMGTVGGGANMAVSYYNKTYFNNYYNSMFFPATEGYYEGGATPVGQLRGIMEFIMYPDEENTILESHSSAGTQKNGIYLADDYVEWFSNHSDYYFGFVVDYRESNSDIQISSMSITHSKGSGRTDVVALVDVDSIPEYPLPDFAPSMPDFNITGNVITDAKSCIPQGYTGPYYNVSTYACWGSNAYAISGLHIPNLSNYLALNLTFGHIAEGRAVDHGNLVFVFGADSPTIGTATGASGRYGFIVEITTNETAAIISYTSPKVKKSVVLHDMPLRSLYSYDLLYVNLTLTQTVEGYDVGMSLFQNVTYESDPYMYNGTKTFNDSITFSDNSINDFSKGGEYLLIGTSKSEYASQLIYDLSMTGTVDYGRNDTSNNTTNTTTNDTSNNSTTTSTDTGSTSKSNGSPTGVIVGASLGGALVTAAAIVYVMRRVNTVPSVGIPEKSAGMYKDENPLYSPKYVAQENEIFVHTDIDIQYERY